MVKVAIKVCERRLRDLNEMIDDPQGCEELVNAAEWKILGADELNEKTLAKKDHEKYLREHNMALPPKSKAKKKRKRKIKTPSEAGRGATPQEDEEEEDEDDLEDDDEEDAVDKAIAKKYPEFRNVLEIIERLRKTFPQTDLNGEQNIWIIKPAQSSRGRGIVLMKNLIEIQQVAK